MRKGSKCIVPNCNAGYASCKEKHHLFSAPKDEKILSQWQKAIPRENFILQSGHVCDKHFLHDDIVWSREVTGPDGKVMASVNINFFVF